MTKLLNNQFIQLLLIEIVISIPLFIFTFSNRNAQVAACDRTNNAIRKPLYEFMTSAAKNRRELAQVSDCKENLSAAKGYDNLANQMVSAVETVAIEEGSPIVDCEKAFPKPWPF